MWKEGPGQDCVPWPDAPARGSVRGAGLLSTHVSPGCSSLWAGPGADAKAWPWSRRSQARGSPATERLHEKHWRPAGLLGCAVTA